MNSFTLRFFLLISVIATLQVLSSTTSLPGCADSCGDVSIPYPFGIGNGCYIEGFDITCNASFSPPKPFIGNTTIELIGISLPKGQVQAYKSIDWACFNRTTIFYTSLFEPFNLTELAAFRISNRNKFTTIGCHIAGWIGGDQSADRNLENQTYISGCMTVCKTLASASTSNGTCAGDGCCQTAIPKGLTWIETGLEFLNVSGDWTFNPCSYAFISEPDWYNFSSADLVDDHFNETYREGAPVALDWSIGNQSCEEARRNEASYACFDSNSECFDSSNGAGYFCNCSTGYEGNPYLKDGCKDIDECQMPLKYHCYFEYCTNTPGNHTCSCPPKTNGDPTIENGCSLVRSTFPVYAQALIGIAGAFLFIFLCFWAHLGLQKTKLIHAKQKFFEQNGGLLLQQQMSSHHGSTAFRLFPKEELEKATNKFNTSRILGRGGYGIVYKGILDDNRIVAIKKSRVMNDDQTKEFAKEMLILSRINHKNVIKLLGCCLEVEVPMLVYEFISNGNLYQYIHINKHSIPLIDRLRIAAESANALAYLHSWASPPIIHGDVKSSNILLDEEYAAKVSDFGASKIAPKDHEEIATPVQGTCGYLDPEYLLTCQLMEKSDVYSFGVVILELLTRRKALDFNASGEEKNLVSCFLLAMKEDKFFEVLDMELSNEDEVLMKEVARIVLQCLKVTGHERPTMKEVAEGLERLLKLKHQQIVEQTNDTEKTNNSLVSLRELMWSDSYAQNNDQESISMNIDQSGYLHGTFEAQGLVNVGSGR